MDNDKNNIMYLHCEDLIEISSIPFKVVESINPQEFPRNPVHLSKIKGEKFSNWPSLPLRQPKMFKSQQT